MSLTLLLAPAVAAQVRAARPDASSWVSANAGSGKTRVLTDRVARLLLAGTEPQKILCLTYTKAAAAEMQNRLFRTLGGWAMLDDAPLRVALTELGEVGAAVPEAELARARTLFARALETPGGLKIQTIHAFCESLLRRFPLEAGVSPGFAVLDDRQARALRAEVLDDLARRVPDAVDGLARYLGGDDPDPFLQEIAQNRVAFATPLDPARLAADLGIAAGRSADDVLAGLLDAGTEARLRSLLAELLASGKADAKAGADLAAALAPGEAERRLAALEAVFLNGPGSKEPFIPKTSFPTAGLRRAHPALAASADAVAPRVAAARAERLAIAAVARAEALDRFARAWIGHFAAAKAARGRLDFDDMIDRAQDLLARPGTAAWVLWRLDGGIDHILVDEAQDTSPAQWRVIETLSNEFFAGEGARAIRRTIFVVGDEKQSIYSFQGADPAEFGAKERHYARALADIGGTLERCDLLHSFRSARPVLDLVDQVFAGPASEGLAGGIRHYAFHGDMPGRVELWPYLPKPDKPDERPWDEPIPAAVPDDPVQALADRIAGTIAGWLAEGRGLPGAGRPIRPADVMILVQRRGPIFDAVIRALKRARVPVAGADLLRIGAELAVNDLLAALRFAATPSDDLSLAAFLRSPLGGMEEEELFALAHPREGSLWSTLRREPPGRWAAARALLDDLRAQADFLRPFELLQRMLVRHDGRRRLVARLGAEAEDGIDALIDQALAYESVEAPSLTGFLDWIDRDEVAVKRRAEEGSDLVRVMTVHAAKGLEAPIVFLPDTGTRQDAANPPQILRLADGRAVWRPRRDDTPEPLYADAERARRRLVRHENRRLLYVALTRAKAWLIVCGAGPLPGSGNGGESWHTLVQAAMTSLSPAREPGPEGETLVLSHRWSAAPAAPDRASATGTPPLPDWTGRPAPAPAAAVPILTPSGLGGVLGVDAGPTGDGPGLDPEAAKARGTAIHRLLEHLHPVPSGARADLAARLLPGAPDLDELLAEALAVLDAPSLAALFGPDSLAEVDVVAPVPGGRLIGRIDRLVVEPGRVLVVDFKSNRMVPTDPAAVPAGILRQLGTYRAALRPVWPGVRIETAVLWTRGPCLMPLPDGLVDAAFANPCSDAGPDSGPGDLDQGGGAP